MINYQSQFNHLAQFNQLTNELRKITYEFISKNIQNKPNLCGFWAVSGDCEEKQTQNKPKTNPIQTQNKPNLPNAQNERKLIYNKGLWKYTPSQTRENKPNSNPTCRGEAFGEAGSNPKRGQVGGLNYLDWVGKKAYRG